MLCKDLCSISDPSVVLLYRSVSGGVPVISNETSERSSLHFWPEDSFQVDAKKIDQFGGCLVDLNWNRNVFVLGADTERFVGGIHNSRP